MSAVYLLEIICSGDLLKIESLEIKVLHRGSNVCHTLLFSHFIFYINLMKCFVHCSEIKISQISNEKLKNDSVTFQTVVLSSFFFFPALSNGKLPEQ